MFLVTMEEVFGAVAKIPFMLRAPHHYASEVATLASDRRRGFPVPRDHAWSFQRAESPVDVRFIVFEKVSGVGLDSIWFGQILKEQLKMVRSCRLGRRTSGPPHLPILDARCRSVKPVGLRRGSKLAIRSRLRKGRLPSREAFSVRR